MRICNDCKYQITLTGPFCPAFAPAYFICRYNPFRSLSKKAIASPVMTNASGSHGIRDIPGTFSVYNSLTAIAVCRHFDVPVEMIKKALKVAKVKGRIEMVKVSEDFTLMIDYAHNAMSLESLLTTLKEYHPKRLVCLFGCGGLPCTKIDSA